MFLLGAFFFPFRVDSFLEGAWSVGNKLEVTVVSLESRFFPVVSHESVNISLAFHDILIIFFVFFCRQKTQRQRQGQ